MNKIVFDFDDNINILAGNPFGREVYKQQMEGKFDINEINELIFPNSVEIIGSSFVQGLFFEYLKKYSYDDIIKHIVINNKEHYQDIEDGLK